ncbi:probable sarcosine oxidase [Solanum pennellii]|uniref:Probable sarcosine oxidase n=1 Tax=Solanum pennellii TaxID=28526 RepID=A0ABM1HC79_SOLPN|nr:probable sarcosine oxidase [Solanum pennellii]
MLTPQLQKLISPVSSPTQKTEQTQTKKRKKMEKPIEKFDVIVIGAGIMGSCTAYEASKRNQKTLLLEQFDFLHHLGSSHGESRTIRATYPEDYYPKMVLKSETLWREAEQQIGYKVYFKTSQLDIGPSNDKAIQSLISSCDKNSIPVRVIDRNTMSLEFDNLIQLPHDWIGVVTEHGGVIKPTKAVSMFQTLAIINGGFLRDKIEIVEIKKDNKTGDVLVMAKNGEKFSGKKCVVTVGSWMNKLVRNISGIVIPIQPLETTVFYWKIKKGYESKFTIGNGFPTFASYGEPYIYGTPSLEYPGLIKIPIHGGRPCEPTDRTWAPTQSLDPLKKWIQERFGGLVESTRPVLTQSCMYSVTPDEDFVIDFLGGEFGEDVVVGGGFSGHGFKMGPIVGKILSDLVIDGETKEVELVHFRIKRFEKNSKGNLKKFDDQLSSAH